MLTEEDFELFKRFRVKAMGDKLREMVDDPSYDDMTFEERMKVLLDAEATARRDRKVAKLVRGALAKLGYTATGGTDSPYIWVDVKGDSWKFFDRLLTGAQVVTTPGAGFGRDGEGFIRISAFNSRENILEAIERFRKVL